MYSELSELNGAVFIKENHEMYNGYIIYLDWYHTSLKLLFDGLKIKGWAKSPALAKEYLGRQLNAIALEKKNGEWFWYHVEDFILEWINEELSKEKDR